MEFITKTIPTQVHDDAPIRIECKELFADAEFIETVNACAEGYRETALRDQQTSTMTIVFASIVDGDDVNLVAYPVPEGSEEIGDALAIGISGHLRSLSAGRFVSTLMVAYPTHIRYTDTQKRVEILAVRGQTADQRYMLTIAPVQRDCDGKIVGFGKCQTKSWLNSKKLEPNEFLFNLWVAYMAKVSDEVDTSDLLSFDFAPEMTLKIDAGKHSSEETSVKER